MSQVKKKERKEREKREEESYQVWRVNQLMYLMVGLTSVLLLVLTIISIFTASSKAQVPVPQEQDVLVLVTQLQDIQSDTQALEIELPETQLREIQPEILEIRMPVTKWLSRQEPQVLILQPETETLEIEVPVAQWLKRHVPEMQMLEIQVPAALLQEMQPETQWLGIQMTVAQLQEMQGTEGLVFVAQIPKPAIISDWFFWLSIFYILFYVAYQQFRMKPRKHRSSKDACMFLARTAAESLEQGNKVRASMSMNRLLSALSDFMRQKLVSLETRPSARQNFLVAALAAPLNFFVGTRGAPRSFVHVTPEKIPRKAVYQAIQASEDTGDFQKMLRDLIIGLGGNVDESYLSASEFLIWLDKETEPYQKVYSQSFFDRYPTLKTGLTYAGPIIVALVAAASLIIQALS